LAQACRDFLWLGGEGEPGGASKFPPGGPRRRRRCRPPRPAIMADLIEGTSGHAHFAPLSHAQTIAISRHLQDQIKAMGARFDDLQRTLEETNADLSAVRDKDNLGGGVVQSLQDGLASISVVVEANRKDIARSHSNIHKMQTSLESANDSITELKDKQKITGTTMEKVEHDLNLTSELAHQLKEDINHRIEKELSQIHDEISKTNLDLKHLKIDEESLKDTVRAEREALRDANLFMKGLADQLAEADTHHKILEHRLNETSSRQKATSQNLEDLNTATLRLNEDHEHTKANTADLQSSVKKAHTHVKQMREGLERTAAGLGMAQGKVEEHNMAVEALRQSLDQANCMMATMKEGHDRATSNIQELGQQLAQVGATTQAVKAGLQEQSSLLLPNIHLDSAEARSASARHGSLLNSTSLGVTTPRGGLNSTMKKKNYAQGSNFSSTARTQPGQNQSSWV